MKTQPEITSIKILIVAAIRCFLMLLVPSVAYATSAQWDLDPISGDWNTADNWTPNGVPNGPGDIATFGLSNTTQVSISQDTEVNGITFTSTATNPYAIIASPGLTLTISGVGIVNNSGFSHTFFDQSGGTIRFTNSSTAGNASIEINGGTMSFANSSTAGNAEIRILVGSTNFFDRSTAGNAFIDSEGGSTNFFDNSTAGSALIFGQQGSDANFFDNSTAGSATFDTFRGTIRFANSSTAGNAFFFQDTIRFTNSSTAGNAFIQNSDVNFFDRSTAGNAFIDNEGGTVNFFDRSTADNSSITVHFGSAVNFFDRSTAGSAGLGEQEEGFANFFDNSTAGSAQIGFPEGVVSFFDNSTASSASISVLNGSLHFADNSTAGSATISTGEGGFISFEDSSQGGTAAIRLFQFFSNLDISGHDAPGVAIGSIEGDGNVFLGANNLSIGSNNLSTTFSGVIQDGGRGGGTGGSLTKIGSGTFILSGANTYTGDTNINGGVLQVDGSITSNTFVNNRSTLAGIGTINGNAVNNSRISPGSIGAPGTLTVTGTYTQTQFATLMIQIAGMSPDQFSLLDVMGNANLNGFLDPSLLNGFVPTIGDSFTFLNYASLTGEFSRIKHRVFDNGMLQWSVIYEANDAVLTVEQHVPDQGSTFVLLTLGLLGLVTFRRQLLRRQP